MSSSKIKGYNIMVPMISAILDPADWKFMVCVMGSLNIAAYGPHKP